jgi:hypothetical protein
MSFYPIPLSILIKKQTPVLPGGLHEVPISRGYPKKNLELPISTRRADCEGVVRHEFKTYCRPES